MSKILTQRKGQSWKLGGTWAHRCSEPYSDTLIAWTASSIVAVVRSRLWRPRLCILRLNDIYHIMTRCTCAVEGCDYLGLMWKIGMGVRFLLSYTVWYLNASLTGQHVASRLLNHLPAQPMVRLSIRLFVRLMWQITKFHGHFLCQESSYMHVTSSTSIGGGFWSYSYELFHGMSRFMLKNGFIVHIGFTRWCLRT